MIKVNGYAAQNAASPLGPFSFERREPGDKDVLIEIAYCGICHSDIHQVRDEWGGSLYPMVPGHEIVGRVTKAGSKVRRFKVGDLAGVGCLVDSCRRCSHCRRGSQQFCATGPSLTYNGMEQDKKTPTYGGYSSHIVVDEAFVVKAAGKIPLEGMAPLLCAGITTYAPLKRWGANKGRLVGVLGLGGLGHMAVKLAAAMGAEVAVLSRSSAKRRDAKRLGAADFFCISDAAVAGKLENHFDLIIDTVSAPHNLGNALAWLKTEGVLVFVGLPPRPLEISAFPLVVGQRVLAGSVIGGIAQTQEMLNFCERQGIASDVEVIHIGQVNEAYERLMRGDVRYRFSIDLTTLR